MSTIHVTVTLHREQLHYSGEAIYAFLNMFSVPAQKHFRGMKKKLFSEFLSKGEDRLLDEIMKMPVESRKLVKLSRHEAACFLGCLRGYLSFGFSPILLGGIYGFTLARHRARYEYIALALEEQLLAFDRKDREQFDRELLAERLGGKVNSPKARIKRGKSPKRRVS